MPNLATTLVAVGVLLAGAITSASAATQYTYDDLNRLIKVQYDDGRSITYTYDAAGNLVQQKASGGLPQAGLVGHWSFDNCNARDSGPNGLNGVVTGAPVCVTGVRGSALRFNGSSDWITVPNSASYPRNAVTLSYWVNREGHPPGTLLQNYISKELAFQSYLNEPARGGGLSAGLWLGRPGFWSSYGGAQAQLTSLTDWVHYAFTYDNATRTARSYINGIQAFETVDADVNSVVRLSSHPMFIGRNGSANVYHIRGLLDEVRIYDRVLSAEEIGQFAPGARTVRLFANMEAGVRLHVPSGSATCSFSAAGTWGHFGDSGPKYGPDGLAGDFNPHVVAPGIETGSLVAQKSSDSRHIKIGSSATVDVSGISSLRLVMNDAPGTYADDVGYVTVTASCN